MAIMAVAMGHSGQMSLFVFNLVSVLASSTALTGTEQCMLQRMTSVSTVKSVGNASLRDGDTKVEYQEDELQQDLGLLHQAEIQDSKQGGGKGG